MPEATQSTLVSFSLVGETACSSTLVHLQSDDVWREGPGPEGAVHQDQKSVHASQPVQCPQQVHAVPAVPTVLTHRLHLLQVLLLQLSKHTWPEQTQMVAHTPHLEQLDRNA